MDEPSNVVHVQHLSNDLTNDVDLIKFALNFGKLSNYLVEVNKGQAYLEFAQQESAKAAILASLGENALAVKVHNLNLKYSEHRSLPASLSNKWMIDIITKAVQQGSE